MGMITVKRKSKGFRDRSAHTQQNARDMQQHSLTSIHTRSQNKETMMDSLYILLLVYASIEAVFFLVFTYYLVPRANKRTIPHEYRDYSGLEERHRLLLRILDRMERTCRSTNQNIRHVLQGFLEQWFHHHAPDLATNTPPPLKRVSLSSSSSTSSPETSDEDEWLDCWTMTNDLGKQDVDTFLSWAFFGKHYQDLTTWEHAELNKFYGILEERYRMVFSPGKGLTKTARLLTLEDVDPLHRPLLLYVIIGILNMLAGMLLLVIGFRRHVTQAGLVYWHRDSAKNLNRLPLLFFHGIAPGGLTFYLPMVLAGIGMGERCCFLFENRPISCSMCFRSYSEKETVAGVLEALETHIDAHTNVSVVGHSFGSCPTTWLLQSPLRQRIKQLVLLDPVTILLSEPDVMNNFLYCRQVHSIPNSTKLETIRQSIHRTKIRLLASSELFTEYYLRRNFSWYNSELWLDDIPPGVQVVVCLAENDEIINASKVKQEVTLHNEHSDQKIKLVYWEGVGHASCVTSTREWAQIRNIMLEQEAIIRKEKTC
jgi:pimeloyl-ACP methyl ester carboxylesterase